MIRENEGIDMTPGTGWRGSQGERVFPSAKQNEGKCPSSRSFSSLSGVVKWKQESVAQSPFQLPHYHSVCHLATKSCIVFMEPTLVMSRFARNKQSARVYQEHSNFLFAMRGT
jgi:hypothetical protein